MTYASDVENKYEMKLTGWLIASGNRNAKERDLNDARFEWNQCHGMFVDIHIA